MRIGILGGSFNPIHKGHIHIAKEVLQKVGLQKVLFIPSCRAPHKSQPDLKPAEDRLKMIEASIAHEPQMEICDIELKRKGISYTIDTLRELKQSHPEWEIFFIIGADMIDNLAQWKDIHKIFQLCEFIVVNREGYEIDWGNIFGLQKNEIKMLKKNFFYIPPVDISSTQIRTLWNSGKDASEMLPEEIAASCKKFVKEKEKIFDVVTKIVNRVDPVNLIGIGAPEDEYSPEVEDIIKSLKEASSKEDLCCKISAIFEQWFCKNCANLEDYQKIAHEIWKYKNQ
jgi:nicotinate-nucleotide adenylyltransferase